MPDDYQALINYVDALRDEVNDRVILIQHAIEGMEKQIALITMALGEQACMLEGLVAVNADPLNADYVEVVRDARKKMLEAMQEGASAIEGSDSKLATTLAAMVEGM